MPLAPAFAEDDSLVERIYRTPRAALANLLRGMARGTLSIPGDVVDLVSKATPGPDAELGPLTRALMDKTDALKATGDPLEAGGEMIGLPGMGTAAKIGLAGSMFVPAKELVRLGKLHPDALRDALRMWTGHKDTERVLAQTGVRVSQPRILRDDKIAEGLVETPNLSIAQVQGNSPLKGSVAGMQARGEITGIDEVVDVEPSILSMMVKRDDASLGPNTKGAYSPTNDTVYLSPNYRPEWSSIFAHELKHKVDHRAGFPSGTSSEVGHQVSNHFARTLQAADNELQRQLLLRQLAEDAGYTARPAFGPAHAGDVLRLWGQNRGVTKGMGQPTERTLRAVLSTPSDEIARRLDIVGKYQERLPSNGIDAYSKDWGEMGARRTQGMMNDPIADVLRDPNMARYDPLGIPDKSAIDIDEFSPQALLQALQLQGRRKKTP